jgi:TatD DNase family protein
MDSKKIFDAHIHFNDENFFNDQMVDEMITEGYKNNVGG